MTALAATHFAIAEALRLLKTTGKSVSEVWKHTAWVPLSMIVGHILQLSGCGPHGWRAGFDGPFLGVGMLHRVASGRICVIGWPWMAQVALQGAGR